MAYAHTQPGTLVRVATAPMVLVSLAMYAGGAGFALSAVPTMFFGVILLLFGSLTVTIDDRHVRLAYGVGLLHKSFDLADIRSAERVRNPWYYFWGIRWYGRGMLYNVSGLDAVRIRFEDGGEARIGTDEPEALEAALRAAIGATRQR